MRQRVCVRPLSPQWVSLLRSEMPGALAECICCCCCDACSAGSGLTVACGDDRGRAVKQR